MIHLRGIKLKFTSLFVHIIVLRGVVALVMSCRDLYM